jgi:hypothetical protein
MKKTARILFYLVIAAFALPVLAQKEVDAAKEREGRNIALLAQIANDARGLKLPENRAYVAAKTGAAIWRADQKEARKLFERAVAELIAAGAEGEAQTRNKQYFQGLIYGQEPRWSILFMIANCDASLALEAMARTRTPSLERALAGMSGGAIGDTGRKSERSGHGNGHYAINEIHNEQRLIGMAADQDPSRAIALVRESLKTGVSYETLTLLKKIFAKDAPAANKLAEEALEKMLGTVVPPENGQYMDTMSYFLRELSREPSPNEAVLRVPEGLIRRMVDKMLDYWLDERVTSLYAYNGSSPVIEKYSPDRAVRLKQKLDKINKQNNGPDSEEYVRLLSGEVPVEEMIARASKLQRHMRNEVFRHAAQKMADGGNLAQAAKLIEDNMTEEEAEQYLSQLESNAAQKSIGAGKFSEANDAIARIPAHNQRINLLLHLANSIYHKDPKNNDKWAVSVLGQARALLPDEPETYEDISAFFNIAAAQAPIDPDSSFRMAEAMIPMLNEFSHANATIAKLRNFGMFRQGEFQITNGQYALGVYGLENVLSTLKEKDFDRAVQITNGFTRPDARLAFQLQLIDTNMTIINLPISTRTFTSQFFIEGE